MTIDRNILADVEESIKVHDENFKQVLSISDAMSPRDWGILFAHQNIILKWQSREIAIFQCLEKALIDETIEENDLPKILRILGKIREQSDEELTKLASHKIFDRARAEYAKRKAKSPEVPEGTRIN